MATLNDVVDFAKFYKGKEEPPVFCREVFDVRGKLFVPFDDYKTIKNLKVNPKNDVILHYFVNDSRQNILFHDVGAHREAHSKVYATTSPDFSVDSSQCFSCLNIGNILKARILAFLWQNYYEERVILNLVWGGRDTYPMAFTNVQKGTIVAVSSQGVKDSDVFINGLKTAIDWIAPEKICWYGRVIGNINEFYDADRIIPMQTRKTIVSQKKYGDPRQLQFNF